MILKTKYPFNLQVNYKTPVINLCYSSSNSFPPLLIHKKANLQA
jgi:hypothetical protein